MSNATFFNFTDKPFTGYWNGKPKTIKAGERVYMPRYLAAHFAKHLTNQVLIENGKETATSPKFPEQVPDFMEVFQKCFIPDADENQSELDAEIASVQPKGPSASIEVTAPKTMNSGALAAADAVEKGPGKEPQIINPPAGDDDEDGFDHGSKA